MITPADLKPCPFCGSPAKLETLGGKDGSTDAAWIACTGDGCDVLMDWNWKESTIESVIESWNRRVKE